MHRSRFLTPIPIPCCDMQDTQVQRKPEQGSVNEDEGSGAMAGRRTLESLSAADSVVDALEMAAAETERMAKAEPGGPRPPANPLMMGLSSPDYVLRAVKVGRHHQALYALDNGLAEGV